MAIGPDGKFPLGAPIHSQDRGGLYAGFKVDRSLGIGAMYFGTEVKWLASSLTEMQQLAATMRRECINAFGVLPYDKSTLPIRVTANKKLGFIELRLPQKAEILAANPEMWLALADEIDTVASSMRKS